MGSRSVQNEQGTREFWAFRLNAKVDMDNQDVSEEKHSLIKLRELAAVLLSWIEGLISSSTICNSHFCFTIWNGTYIQQENSHLRTSFLLYLKRSSNFVLPKFIDSTSQIILLLKVVKHDELRYKRFGIISHGQLYSNIVTSLNMV